MSSKRIFTSNIMDFTFNMYNHDFYHSLLVYLTFDITYEDFNNLHIDSYNKFISKLIEDISFSAEVHKLAVTITNSSNSIEHSSIWKDVIQFQIEMTEIINNDVVSNFVEFLNNTIQCDQITIYKFENKSYINLVNGIENLPTIEQIELDIQNYVNTNNIDNILIVSKTNVVIPIVIHHINIEHLNSFVYKLNNELSNIFSDEFNNTYGFLLYINTQSVTHQLNSISNIEKDITIKMDFISLFQSIYQKEKTHYQKTEEYREHIFKEAYNNYNNTDNGDSTGKNVKDQWLEHLHTILFETVYRQNPVLNNFIQIEEDDVIKSLEYRQFADINNNKILKHISHSYRYSTKRLGNLINNFNVEEIINKLYLNGYFLKDDSIPEDIKYIFNPDTNLVDNSKYPLYSPLQDNDQIIFPVTISSIYGYSDKISMKMNTSIYIPYTSLYTINIKCIQTS